jgi:hypothetical protein
MGLGSSGGRQRAVALAALLLTALTVVGAPAAAAAAQATPNLTAASAYLVRPGNLVDGHYYQSFPGTADFGLTIDGALALAATGDQDAALRTIVAFLDADGRDPSGQSVNDWTGIGTADASGGAIGKEALLVEVVGGNPRGFGGHNLITALDASVCAKATTGGNTACPAAGSYLNDTSTFDQALGVIAQLRAGQVSQAAAPIAYLERLQSADGAYSSLIPPSGGPDVDSTAMAVMALALVPGARASAAVTAGLRWITGRQQGNGGFLSAGAESTNSTGLAIQALTLRTGTYRARIAAAEAFLAGQQNGNGGFNADAGQPGANLRASTQAAGGAVGTSFGTLRVDLSGRPAVGTPSASSSPASSGQSSRPGSGTGHPTARPTASARTHPGQSATPTAQAQSAAATPSAGLTLGTAPPVRAHASASAPSQTLTIVVSAVVAAAIIAGVVTVILRRRRRRHPDHPPTAPAGPVEPAAPAGSIAPADSAAPPAEARNPAGPAVPAEDATAAVPATPADSALPAESGKPAEPAAPAAAAMPVETAAPTEPIALADSAAPAELIERSEPAQPVDPVTSDYTPHGADAAAHDQVGS